MTGYQQRLCREAAQLSATLARNNGDPEATARLGARLVTALREVDHLGFSQKCYARVAQRYRTVEEAMADKDRFVKARYGGLLIATLERALDLATNEEDLRRCETELTQAHKRIGIPASEELSWKRMAAASARLARSHYQSSTEVYAVGERYEAEGYRHLALASRKRATALAAREAREAQAHARAMLIAASGTREAIEARETLAQSVDEEVGDPESGGFRPLSTARLRLNRKRF